MILFIRLAVRNIFRNHLRTTVALLAIAAGCAALIVNAGIVFNIFRELREDAIRGRIGHLQIYRRGYSEHHLEAPEQYLIPGEETQSILRLVRADSRVLRATRRLEFSGLATVGQRHAPFLGVGVDADDDSAFSSHSVLRAGRPLSSGDPSGVLAGLGLAMKLNAQPEDEISLMTIEGGTLNAVQVRLRGTFEGGFKDYDDWTLKVPLPVVERLLMNRNTGQILLLLARTEDTQPVREELEMLFQRQHLDLEIRSWSELAVFHNQVVNLFGKELNIMRAIIGIIVILGIANSIGMSIMERRVELATMRALGIRPRAVAALLMTEALITGILGAFLGILLGLGLALAVNQIGIPYPTPPGSTRPFLGGVDIVPGAIVTAGFLSVAGPMMAAILPICRLIWKPLAPELRQH